MDVFVGAPAPNGPFEIVERPIPEPGAGTIRSKVLACGICHSDSFVKDGDFPGVQYPGVPGHEAAGVIDAVGAGATDWKPCQRVGVGWNGGSRVAFPSARGHNSW
jgi:D-arabinose 1-dehydrogenase-like Zn-dependent alcohol dehydrogenase